MKLHDLTLGTTYRGDGGERTLLEIRTEQKIKGHGSRYVLYVRYSEVADGRKRERIVSQVEFCRWARERVDSSRAA